MTAECNVLEVKDEITSEMPDETLLWCPCFEHVICKRCLVRLATSFGSGHPINATHPMIQCPYPFEECVGELTPYYFPHSTILRLLSDPDKRLYEERVNRFQFPGYELVPCPRPNLRTGKCGAGILVPIQEIQQTQMGYLIMQCDQALDCLRKSCYHCQAIVHRGHTVCDICITSVENTNPNALNHYFTRPNKHSGDGLPNLMKNNEITEDIAYNAIKEIIGSDRLEIKCTECMTALFKSEQCNTLEHCGIERCFSCGRSGTRNQKLGDHWDSAGVKGCPRFDHSIFWNVVDDCKFDCIEGHCYNEEIGDCQDPKHQSGIQNMIDSRKKAHIYHAIKSLLPEMRIKVANRLIQERLGDWVPRRYSSDYRTYLCEPVERTSKKANRIFNSFAPNVELPEEERVGWEFARDFVNKASGLQFSNYDFNWSVPPRHRVIFEEFRKKYAPRRAARALRK